MLDDDAWQYFSYVADRFHCSVINVICRYANVGREAVDQRTLELGYDVELEEIAEDFYRTPTNGESNE